MSGPRLVGWLDPAGTQGAALAAWAAAAGARCAVASPPFQLCCWPDGQVCVSTGPTRTEAVAGVRFGGPAPTGAETGCEAGDGQLLCVSWAPGAGRLRLFRDDSASQDLFYRPLPGGGVLFADDLDLIAAAPGAPARIDRPALHEFLRFLDIATPNTPYAGIRSPEPGVPLVLGPGLPPRPDPRPAAMPGAVPRDLQGAADALERRLGEAVSVRLPPRGTVIVFLSGGLDSALIAALAARAAPGRVLAYTVGFAEAACDESGAAARIAAHLGLPHRVLCPDMTQYRAAFEDWSAAVSRPCADPAALPSLLGFRDARSLGAVALDGTGADELVGILPAPHRRKAVWLASLLPRPALRAAADLCRALPAGAGLLPCVEFDDAPEYLIRWRGWSRRDLERLCGEPVSLGHTRYYRIFRGFWPWEHFARYSRLLASMPDDRIHEASRLTGLGVRFPFFDARVAALVRALPRALRYAPGEPKRILRAVLARHVPRHLWDTPKHGFDFPFADLLRLADFELPRHYLAAERLRALERAGAGVDPQVVAETLGRFRAGESGLAFRVWALTVLSAWITNHWEPRRRRSCDGG